MSRRARMQWRRLWVGVLVTAGMVVLALAVLLYARVGALRGDTYTLFVEGDRARGVLRGTEVWLDGQKVGLVDGVGLSPVVTDTLERVILELEVLEDVQSLIRRNSRVQIRSGGSLIGAPVIWISSGTPDAPVLQDGDTLLRTRQLDLEGITAEFAGASRHFPEILANIKTLRGELLRTAEHLDQVASGDLRVDGVADVAGNVERLAQRLATGPGLIGRVLREERLEVRLQRVLARTDTLLRTVQRRELLIGRFRSDSALLVEVQDVRNELSILRARLRLAEGTAGRVLHDEALQRQLEQIEEALQRLFEDIKLNPARYIGFPVPGL